MIKRGKESRERESRGRRQDGEGWGWGKRKESIGRKESKEAYGKNDRVR